MKTNVEMDIQNVLFLSCILFFILFKKTNLSVVFWNYDFNTYLEISFQNRDF